MNELLEKRKKLKAKKPTFLRGDSNRLRFKNKWRKPRGLHNKRRLQKDGHQKNPSQGYRSPKAVRGLHISGLELIQVNNLTELKAVNPATQIVEIPTRVGLKNKLKILEECKTKKIQVSNIKDIDQFIKNSNEELAKKKKEKQKKAQKKKKSKEESKKKAEEKKNEEETGEEKQEKTKEEVMKAKQEVKQQPVENIPKSKDVSQSKAGHKASSVPGTKQ